MNSLLRINTLLSPTTAMLSCRFPLLRSSLQPECLDRNIIDRNFLGRSLYPSGCWGVIETKMATKSFYEFRSALNITLIYIKMLNAFPFYWKPPYWFFDLISILLRISLHTSYVIVRARFMLHLDIWLNETCYMKH